MSLWQDLEALQKRRTELEGQLNSSSDRAKTLEERTKAVEAELGVQEERVRRLEEQLKDKLEAMSKLESRIVGIEKILKQPNEESVKETAREEFVMEETAREELSNDSFKLEQEEQPVEMTVQTAAGDSAQPQTEEIEQKESKKRKRWLQSR